MEWLIFRMPFRVEMPVRVIKPIIEATESGWPAIQSAVTEPIKASGTLAMIEERSRERKGYEALSEGMLAVASGEGRLAQDKAARAARFGVRVSVIPSRAAAPHGPAPRALPGAGAALGLLAAAR